MYKLTRNSNILMSNNNALKWKSLSCVRLCDPWTIEVHGILQARILVRVAIPFSGGSSQPRDWTQVSCIVGSSFPAEPQGKPKNTGVGSLSLLQWIFPIQEPKQSLLHCRWILYQLSCREAQEYWSGWPISSPEDLPNPGIKLGSPALQAVSLPTQLWGKPLHEWRPP